MVNFPYVMIFSFTMIFGSIFSLSSSHWFGVWLGLEINLLSFIPIMVEKGGSLETECAIKYFLVQAVGSALFMLGILTLTNSFTSWGYSLDGSVSSTSLIFFGLLIKLGAAPFHLWVPGVVSGLSWMCNFLLLTWQKVAPLMVLSSFLALSKFSLLFLIVMSSVFGGAGGVNQSSIRGIVAYSSILHLGWVMAASYLSFIFTFFYFFLYSLILGGMFITMMRWEIFTGGQFLNIYSWGSEDRMFLLFMLLSLGGMPPLLGFFGKWGVLAGLTDSGEVMVSMILVFGSLASLYYYLVLSFSLLAGVKLIPKNLGVNMMMVKVVVAFLNFGGLSFFLWFLGTF
uniref:NADH-ubiquinone oxidoreductase chain 2 n=1 Tax=Hemiarthrum setulosum TaxID=1437515 RepID=A0A6H1PG52_9MOLL|nr:NADH dehydrogenase subunit 2 [Hemiarthrum setulosum]